MFLRFHGARLVPLLFLLVLVPAAADAALISRAGGAAVYDSDLDVTWLADANYAQTSGFDADGLMPRATAQAWVDGLTVLGVSDWRLPTNPVADGSCFDQSAGIGSGANCVGGELGYLLEISDWTQSPDFVNVQPWFYWSSQTNPITGQAFVYGMHTAITGFGDPASFPAYTWLVRDGDIGGVPEPSTALLLGLGLGALARRRTPER